jgi:hypothetical protein
MDDPAYAHLADCSPCYQAFRRLQDEPVILSSPTRGVAPVWWVAAAALALVVAGVWWWRGASSANVPNAQAPTVAMRLTVDLRPYAVSRSTDTSATVPPLRLPASRLDLTILLPTGAEPGSYDVRLVDASRSLAAASGPAEIRDFITTLTTTLDLQPVPPGNYRLDLRRRGEEWRSFPVVVQ